MYGVETGDKGMIEDIFVRARNKKGALEEAREFYGKTHIPILAKYAGNKPNLKIYKVSLKKRKKIKL